MAMITATVTFTASNSQPFTFTKPLGNYGKTAGLTITDGNGAVKYIFRGADVDNGNGTMTGTIELDAAVTGTAEIQIFDKL